MLKETWSTMAAQCIEATSSTNTGGRRIPAGQIIENRKQSSNSSDKNCKPHVAVDVLKFDPIVGEISAKDISAKALEFFDNITRKR